MVILIVGIVILCCLLFVPRNYNVAPFKERTGTKYWALNTGSKIGYTKIKRAGLETKNPIIYLHGGPGGRIKDELIETLRPLSKFGHDLYFYDQVGSGHSERLKNIEEYSVNRHQKDLKEIIVKTGFDNVILIGHSWGAVLAINYLQDNEKSIEKIILSGPGPILPINKKVAKEVAPDSLSLRKPAFSNKEGNKKAYNWRNKLILKWAQLFNSKLVSDKEVDNFFTYLNQELSKSTACNLTENRKYEGGGGYYSHIMTVKSIYNVEDKRTKLKEVSTPILILRGQCDNQKWGYAKEYLDLFANARLTIIENVGHDLIGGNSDKYYQLIEEYLTEK